MSYEPLFVRINISEFITRAPVGVTFFMADDKTFIINNILFDNKPNTAILITV